MSTQRIKPRVHLWETRVFTIEPARQLVIIIIIIYHNFIIVLEKSPQKSIPIILHWLLIAWWILHMIVFKKHTYTLFSTQTSNKKNKISVCVYLLYHYTVLLNRWRPKKWRWNGRRQRPISRGEKVAWLSQSIVSLGFPK